jgi:S-ribosylhomocysteine lyase LuxS involved in autoinducer biosynthesis
MNLDELNILPPNGQVMDNKSTHTYKHIVHGFPQSWNTCYLVQFSTP